MVNPTLSKSEYNDYVPAQPLVEKVFDMIPLSVDAIYLVESELNTIQVLFVSSDSKELRCNPPILKKQGGDPPIPMVQGRILLFL